MSRDPSLWSALRRKLRKQGFDIRMSGSMHYKVYKDGKLVTVMPSSPGGGRAYLNQVSQLRKAGANL